jgi:hypothetical protein
MTYLLRFLFVFAITSFSTLAVAKAECNCKGARYTEYFFKTREVEVQLLTEDGPTKSITVSQIGPPQGSFKIVYCECKDQGDDIWLCEFRDETFPGPGTDAWYTDPGCGWDNNQHNATGCITIGRGGCKQP